jgi:hypothetical protein
MRAGFDLESCRKMLPGPGTKDGLEASRQKLVSLINLN